MRRMVLIAWIVATSAVFAQPQLNLPQAPPMSPRQAQTPAVNPPPATTTINLAPSPLYSAPRSGDRVRVIHGTTVRSASSDLAYPCGTLEAGMTVELVAPPEPGGLYATITVPETCHALIPPKAVERFFKIKDFRKRYPILLKAGVQPLIDGEVPRGSDYLVSPLKLSYQEQVEILDIKVITIQGKQQYYYQIKSDYKGNRYVLASDLEGVRPTERETYTPGAPQAQGNANAVPGFTGPNSPYGSPHLQPASSSATPPIAVAGDQEALPHSVEAQVRAAEQAYLNGIRHHAWEDARIRYLQLLDCDLPSVRILAINRLEFIRRAQADPQVISTRFPQQDGSTAPRPLPPPMNPNYWVPGNQATAQPTTKPGSARPIKEVTIRPETTPATTATPTPATPLANTGGGAVPIPVYTPPLAKEQPHTPPQSSIRREPPAGQLASTANVTKKKVTGRLYRAAQSDGLNPLYYLANSQGGTTYYVRAWTNSRINLASFEGKAVELEGQVHDRRRDLAGYQINIDWIRELR